MASTTSILVTLIVYKIVLILIGIWANKRTSNASEYILGGRKLGPWVAALSASASSSSAWTLLGVSGAAYLWGLPAIWLFPATLSGFLINQEALIIAAHRQRGLIPYKRYRIEGWSTLVFRKLI